MTTIPFKIPSADHRQDNKVKERNQNGQQKCDGNELMTQIMYIPIQMLQWVSVCHLFGSNQFSQPLCLVALLAPYPSLSYNK